VFHGTGGKVTWTEFEKSIARYCRLKYGSEIGDMLWRNEMPVIEGDDAIDRDEFKEHCQIVLEAISVSQSQRYIALKPQNSGFWEVDYTHFVMGFGGQRWVGNSNSVRWCATNMLMLAS
jgi:hypothetical protein